MNEILEIQQNNSTSILYDVIIVGAGPVGLFLASELALANCSVLVLEKAETSFSPLKKILSECVDFQLLVLNYFTEGDYFQH
jgi:2-polyprenyl-6-methoxyphenol hydroxylase-like FAD-dependent oxidoreductase